MAKKVKWGVLGAANIAMTKVIPAMQRCSYAQIYAIASRNLEKGKSAAEKLNIPKVFGTYEELINDKEIEAVYIPLPNHLHVEWVKKCILAGKHVLCEKPLSLRAEEIKELIKLRNENNVKVGEAFMVRSHPQWMKTLDLIKGGKIGKLAMIHGFFSYFNKDSQNIRNILKFGGGSAYDIGCYPINTSRLIFGEEPKRVMSLIDYDKEFKTDKLTSVILDFPSGQATFTSATQIVPYQVMQFFGSEKMLEIEIPFNPSNDKPTKISVHQGDILSDRKMKIEIETCDQYTIQGDNFSLSILENKPVIVPLEDALLNTAVIEAVIRSSKSGKWEIPQV